MHTLTLVSTWHIQHSSDQPTTMHLPCGWCCIDCMLVLQITHLQPFAAWPSLAAAAPLWHVRIQELQCSACECEGGASS
jgi:hypothetical protein